MYNKIPTKFYTRIIPKPWMNYTLRLYLNIITYKFYKNSVSTHKV